MADADATTAETCRRCGGEMQRGFVLDEGQGIWGRWSRPSNWHPGEVRYGGLGGLAFDRDRLLPIVALRCGSCGLLDLFAVPPRR